MESKIAGKLKPLENDPDYFESEAYSIPYFNNKKLKIGFIEALHETYLSEADKVLEKFLKLDSSERVKNSKIVYDYYEEVLLNGYTNELDIESVEEIWNFVYPSDIIIFWDENGDFYLCVSCACDWEEEHGLQLVFKDGLMLTRASGHDGGFTD